MADYLKLFTGLITISTRSEYNKWKGVSLDKLDIYEEVSKYVNKSTLYPYLSNIVYGHIIPELEIIDDIRLSIWVQNYGMDAAESTIPLKFGPQGKGNAKFRLKASANHICDEWGYHLWYTRFLEKAAEKYEVILVDQLGSCIARNMQLVKKCNDFSIKLSMDTGTQGNVENIRNCLVQGMFKYLNLSPKTQQYKNTNNVVFDLRKFRITVKSYILYLI